VRSFNVLEVEIGDLKFTVTEASISVATELPQEGERWFKNKSIGEEAWRVILHNPGMDVTIFKRGIHVHALEEKWASLLLVIQKFITCEGRFGAMYMYHTRLLMKFLENQTLNLPYLLLLSLKKMATTVQKNIEDIDPHLYHHGLVKILIEDQLRKKRDTWEWFLVRNYFQDPPEVPESSTVRKSRKRETSIRIQNPPISKTKEVDQEEKLERTKDKKQKKLKGKKDIEDVYQSPEPSLEEDHQPLFERLTHLQGQSTVARKKEKEKQSIEEEGTSPQNLRRSIRLKGKWRKA